MNKILQFDLKKIKLSFIDYSILQNNTKDTILLQVDGNSEDFSKDSCRFIIADTDASVAYWKEKKCPVIAWSHENNKEEDLMGASFMILSLDALTSSYLEEIYCRFYQLPLIIKQTEHWTLRELTMDDLPHLIALDEEQAKESSGRFFPLELSKKYEQQKQFLSDYIKNQYAFYGFGIYAAYENASETNRSDFLGIVGLSSLEEKENMIEIGYAVKKSQQRNGLATQWIHALITYAENELEIPIDSIVARIDPNNTASIKTAKKCGIRIHFVK